MDKKNTVDIENIVSMVKNLIPFWSSKILTFFSLGNEYSMLTTFIISSLVDFFANFFVSVDIVYLIGIIITVLSVYKFNLYQYLGMSSFFSKNSIVYVGTENYKDGKDEINYPQIMIYLNNYIIEKLNVQNVRYVESKHLQYVVIDLPNTCIDKKKGIFLTIERNNSFKIGQQSNYSSTEYNVTYALSGKNNSEIKLWVETLLQINAKNNNVILHGSEMMNGVQQVVYPVAMSIINNLMIEKGISNTKLVGENNSEHVIDTINNFMIDDDIFISVTRKKTDKDEFVQYNIHSSVKNVKKWLFEIINNEKHKKGFGGYELRIEGFETQKKEDYPIQIKALNDYLVRHCDFNKVKICDDSESVEMEKLFHDISNDNKNGGKDNNNRSNTSDEVNKNERKIKFSLDDIQNFPINNEITLDITRIPYIGNRDLKTIVYKLKSKNNNLIEFIKKIVSEYTQSIMQNQYKHILNIRFGQRQKNQENFFLDYSDKLVQALNYYIINNYESNNVVCYDRQSQGICKVNKFIDPDFLINSNFVKLEEDLFLTIKKFMNEISWTFESDTKDLKKFIKNITNSYEQHLAKINQNKLYHFTFNGVTMSSKDGSIMKSANFISELLHEYKSTDNTNCSSNQCASSCELYESFDCISNEHVEYFKRDIDLLKNIAYYKKTGQRRKRSYLFHGKPGTGKTSTIVAMALYSNSHIIEIPGGSLKNSDDIDTILSTQYINGVKISKTNLIVVLDEIDVGIEKFNRQLNRTQLNQIQSNQTQAQPQVCSKIITKSNDGIDLDTDSETEQINQSNQPNQSNQSDGTTEFPKSNINLANLLSRLDGISNYNGLMIIATTNHIEFLDPAMYREMRLTPIEFKNLRKEDVISIIKRYFDILITPEHELYPLIKDREITPAKTIYLCDMCYKLQVSVDELVKNHLFPQITV